MPFERQCAFARSVGYDAIEIAPFTLTDPTRLCLRAGRSRPDRFSITSLHYLLRAPRGLSITRPMQASATARSTSCARCAGWPPISAPASSSMARRFNARWSRAKRTRTQARRRLLCCGCRRGRAGARRLLHRAAVTPRDPVRQHRGGGGRGRTRHRQPGGAHHDRLFGGRTGGSSPGRRPRAPLGAHGPHRPHPFQRPEPARSGRRNDGIRTHSRGARCHQIPWRRRHRAVHLRARRPHMRRAADRLSARLDRGGNA